MTFPFTGSYVDDIQRLEQAMQTWEAKGAQLKATEAAMSGLLVGLSSLPGLGVPLAIMEARKRSAQAALRAAYHRGRQLIALNTEHYDKYVRRDARHELALILAAIEKAAGISR